MPRCFTGWQCGQCSAGVKIVFSFRAFTPAALVPRWCRVGVVLRAVLDVPCYFHPADCVVLSVLCFRAILFVLHLLLLRHCCSLFADRCLCPSSRLLCPFALHCGLLPLIAHCLCAVLSCPLLFLALFTCRRVALLGQSPPLFVRLHRLLLGS